MAKLIDFSSTRFSLAVIIFIMGLLGFVFVILSGNWYKALVLENELRAYQKLLQYEVHEDLQEHEERVTKMTQALLKTKDFKDAFRNYDKMALQKLLNDQFHQYFVTAKRIHLYHLAILDLNYRAMVQSTEENPDNLSIENCIEVVARAKTRKGTAQLKLFADICLHHEKSLHIQITPIGGLRPKGFLMVLTDPVSGLREISRELNSPIEFRLGNGKVIERAGVWPVNNLEEDWAKTHYIKENGNNKTVLVVEIYKDTGELRQILKSTRLQILLIACVTTVVVIVVAFFFLNSRLLNPLQKLNQHLQRIQKNRRHLTKPLEIQGNAEMQQLADSFNEMGSELSHLYNKLEQMAFSDALTNLPNRAWFYQDLKRLAKLSARNMDGFALLFLDLNKFKLINDKYGHQIGDEVLKVTSERILNVIRGSDFMARVNNDRDKQFFSRMGGDEFAILLPAVIQEESAVKVANKIMAAVLKPIPYNDLELQLGISIGIAFFPHDSNEIEALVHCADLAMYQAKEQDSGYAVFNRSMLVE